MNRTLKREARELVKRLADNADAYCNGKVPFEQFSKTNRAIWDDVAARGIEVQAFVTAELRARLNPLAALGISKVVAP